MGTKGDDGYIRAFPKDLGLSEFDVGTLFIAVDDTLSRGSDVSGLAAFIDCLGEHVE